MELYPPGNLLQFAIENGHTVAELHIKNVDFS